MCVYRLKWDPAFCTMLFIVFILFFFFVLSKIKPLKMVGTVYSHHSAAAAAPWQHSTDII